jgi:hypothetical protein
MKKTIWVALLGLSGLVVVGCADGGGAANDDVPEGRTEGTEGTGDDDAGGGDRVDDAGEGGETVGDDGGCTPTGDELCDGLDNDCDGETDEGFEFTTDLDNCGGCGLVCLMEHATGGCSSGICSYTCDAGWVDLNESGVDGCEYECTASGTAESMSDGTCGDGLDNDCDGRTDLTDRDCASCIPELCNGDDDDCDGLTDEDFDVDFDPDNCGSCGFVCPDREHASAACVLGACALECEAGWSDLDGNPANGCEIECVPEAAPDETTCDGADDDCDGSTDEDFVGTPCGEGLCWRSSVCWRGSESTCTPRTPPAVVDVTCDGLDDDCDGVTDDEADCSCTTAADCDDANPCTDDACGTDSLCTVGTTTNGTPCPGGTCCDRVCAGPAAESCNGLDDNCDTACDETFGCCLGTIGACTTGSGTPGTRSCGPGCSFGPCEAAGDPCNGSDDDGDTRCDEDFECCAGGGRGCMTGCGLSGTSTCGGSCSWGACEPPATAYRCPSGGPVYEDRGACTADCSETADCSCSTSTEYYRVAGGFEGGCECAPGDPPTCECETICFSGSCPCRGSSAVGSPPSGSYWVGDGCDSYLTGATFYGRDTTDCTCPLGGAGCSGSPPRCTVTQSCNAVPGC